MLQLLNFMNQFLIVREERRLRDILTRHQRGADEKSRDSLGLTGPYWIGRLEQ